MTRRTALLVTLESIDFEETTRSPFLAERYVTVAAPSRPACVTLDVPLGMSLL